MQPLPSYDYVKSSVFHPDYRPAERKPKPTTSSLLAGIRKARKARMPHAKTL